jgi:hypothetical protein
VTEYIAELLRGMRGTDEEDTIVSYEKLAAELGITKPQIFNIVNHGKGAGPKVEQAFADKLFGGSRDQLRAAAQGRARERNAEVRTGSFATGTSVSKNPRYDSLVVILSEPRHKDRWSRATIAAVESLALDAESDPGTEWFLEALNRLDSVIRVSSPKLPPRGDAAIAGLDERPVRPARKKR